MSYVTDLAKETNHLYLQGFSFQFKRALGQDTLDTRLTIWDIGETEQRWVLFSIEMFKDDVAVALPRVTPTY